jgi:hypothetical protein
MKAYVATSGAVFGLLTAMQAVHAVRDPEHWGEWPFLVHLAGSLVFALWSARLLAARAKPSA